MNIGLRQESEKLAGVWMGRDAGWLRDYLVAGVEDPRLNLQSVLSRHFLVRAIAGERWSGLMEQEYRFAAALNWLIRLAGQFGDTEELGGVMRALRRGADNAEGVELPFFLRQLFAALPASADGLTVPNYIESFLANTPFVACKAQPCQTALDTFRTLWRTALTVHREEEVRSPKSEVRSPKGEDQSPDGASDALTQHATRNTFHAPSVLEPACGSANDYRFLDAYGLASLVDYTGFDLCASNVENARTLFPGARFEVGNVFEIAAPDKAFDLCFVHDLFEHLSAEGMEAAAREICRVTRQGICVGFFNLDEIPEHQVRPVEGYHWNTLSLGRMKELFARHGFAAQVLHIGAFLRHHTGCEQTHNLNAYTFILRLD